MVSEYNVLGSRKLDEVFGEKSRPRAEMPISLKHDKPDPSGIGLPLRGWVKRVGKGDRRELSSLAHFLSLSYISRNLFGDIPATFLKARLK